MTIKQTGFNRLAVSFDGRDFDSGLAYAVMDELKGDKDLRAYYKDKCWYVLSEKHIFQRMKRLQFEFANNKVELKDDDYAGPSF